ncbi:GNAT family N-acetyltransferase [Agrobacterium sp. SHOUNA12C]|uniref:N-acetyltransferase protein n=2 Tax=Rhizobium rhizogenes TaxID=359 RepID=B9JFB6_RHIR8|nr:GNAT family N-acetyltransferase [Rhizobium rhizogenes]ACM26606.1 N-acetyltransferase protein [Rhizobium rhizogenes K84]KAA6490602.1 GNAT family N-acetyltransferase [Agrobacterium sp. ICMP 7243]MCJ9721952.1 GNAT family N-acetyltransferase [Agrobacterium sp. BETTINA12B]MCJ9756552.1 GNAT family N-acetyltransferase [Agrobacterium sp. SHOUNA12C]OCJ06114.1 acetyltransferase [Agrobacterium sp. 13-626]OCJ25691.1 acetyltransferase [Agrobacterium sp. B131/95]
MNIRPAESIDAQGMSNVLNEIFDAGLRKSAGDVTLVLAQYIEHEHRIECSVAEDEQGQILGFQSLRYAVAGNPYGVSEDWGIIGTHVSPRAGRQGIGSALFQATLRAAKTFGLQNIDATIGEGNKMGLAYYEAMGFRTYRSGDGSISKAYKIDQ